MTTQHAVTALADGYYEVVSGNSGKKYRVARSVTGLWALCECAFFRHRSRCSHVDAVIEFAGKVSMGGARQDAGYLGVESPVVATAKEPLVRNRQHRGGEPIVGGTPGNDAAASSPAAALQSLPLVDPLEILSQADLEIAKYAGLSPEMAARWAAEEKRRESIPPSDPFRRLRGATRHR